MDGEGGSCALYILAAAYFSHRIPPPTTPYAAQKREGNKVVWRDMGKEEDTSGVGCVSTIVGFGYNQGSSSS